MGIIIFLLLTVCMLPLVTCKSCTTAAPCTATNMACTDGLCTCISGYYYIPETCRPSAGASCSNTTYIESAVVTCGINVLDLFPLISGTLEEKCKTYLKLKPCFVDTVQSQFRQCTSAEIQNTVASYVNGLTKTYNFGTIDFTEFYTCNATLYKVTLVAKSETWYPALGDTSTQQYWFLADKYSGRVNALLKSAFPDSFIDTTITSARNGSVLLDVVLQVNQIPVNTMLSTAITNSILADSNTMATFEFRSISPLTDTTCTFDGITYSSGETYMSSDTCNRCVCNNGQSTCTSMNCSNVWLNEYCLTNTDCGTTGAQCTSNSCKCTPGLLYIESEATCATGASVGSVCDVNIPCSDSHATCTNSLCTCQAPYAIMDNTNICKLGLGGPCQASAACGTAYSGCIGQQCACISGYYQSDSQCLQKKKPGTVHVCTASSECVDNAECVSGKCQCMDTHTEQTGGCYLGAVPGSPCSDFIPCMNRNTECVEGSNFQSTCVCTAHYTQLSSETSCLANLNQSCEIHQDCRPLYSGCIGQQCKCIHGYYEANSLCIKQKKVGGVCSRDIECEVTAICSGTCQCKDSHWATAYGDCYLGAHLGNNCGAHVECMDHNSVCAEIGMTSTCICSKQYTQVNGENKCLADINRECSTKNDCRPENTNCTESKCQCMSGYKQDASSCVFDRSYCTTNSHCSQIDIHMICSSNKCTCGDDYFTVQGMCKRRAGATCTSEASILTAMETCDVDLIGLSQLIIGTFRAQCKFYLKFEPCILASIQSILATCTNGEIIAGIAAYANSFIAQIGMPPVDFSIYEGCKGAFFKVSLTSKTDVWTTDLADQTSRRHWNMKDKFKISVTNLLQNALPELIKATITGFRQGSVIVDVVVEVNEAADGDITSTITDTIAADNDANAAFELESVTEIIDVTCIVDGIVYNTGDTYRSPTDTCNRCVCNQGQSTCTNMDCSSGVWIDEYCTSTSACGNTDAVCENSVCKCPMTMDYNSTQDACVQKSVLEAALGEACYVKTDCVLNNTVCLDDQCACATGYKVDNNLCVAETTDTEKVTADDDDSQRNMIIVSCVIAGIVVIVVIIAVVFLLLRYKARRRIKYVEGELNVGYNGKASEK